MGDHLKESLVNESHISYRRKLNAGSSVQLLLADNQDIEPLRSLYRVIVDEGNSYPHDRHACRWICGLCWCAMAGGMVDKRWTFQ